MVTELSLQTRRALLENVASAYREAPPANKRVLLDEFPQTTGYHRTYARWLLKHSGEVLQVVVRHPLQSRYGPEVVDALVQAWNANNRKCTKCLIPFLPTLLDSEAECPLCHGRSARIHSRYVRAVADLPWEGCAVRLELHIRRFFCTNAECTKTIW